MKLFCKKLLSVFLVTLIILTSIIRSAAYSVDDVTDAAMEIIIKHEGLYTTVLSDDVGALSIGKVGWHATRALNLLKTIVNADTQNATEILGEELYSEIISSTDWDNRILTEDETAKVKTLLATEESIKAQDELSRKDIGSYISHGRNLGFNDGKVLVYFADLENQMGAEGAQRVAEAAVESAETADKVTLDTLYESAMNDKTAQNSPVRRLNVYKACAALTFGENLPDITFSTGDYTVDVNSSLNVRSGPGQAYQVIGSLYNNDEITVTEVSGDWGKIDINGQSGWINLNYAVYMNNESSEVQGITGDVTSNGRIEAADARLIMRFSAGLEELTSYQQKYADVNSDSKITSQDARTVLRISSGLESI